MSHQFEILLGNPYPLGATPLSNNEINFAVVLNTVNICGIVLYEKNTKEETRIPFKKEHKIGDIYCIKVAPINPHNYEYNFFIGEKVFTDPYAKIVWGNEKWGSFPENLKAGFINQVFDWEDDRPLMIEYKDSIFYLLHVRGFTMHHLSGVKNPGTFEGIIEKIPYMKELGINTIEVMPCYEFLEMEETTNSLDSLDYFSDNNPKMNYWGYKKAYYFAPKYSYCKKDENDCTVSFKNMIKQLHKNGIELIMQFYFPEDITQSYILDVLKYWIYEYHIDGAHLMGAKIPTALLATEPMLSNTKLIYYDFPVNDIYKNNELPSYKNIAVSNDNFMYDVRKFLKSDEGMISKVLYHLKNDSPKNGIVHYITHCNGFTLADIVSYDRKHNDINGEHNMDGNPYNCSWNCGFEGKTRKKNILDLRIKQMKNACIFNLLSQSTPLILSGDEFGNSQEGNNNPYCQDNKITWLNWDDLDKNNEIYHFVKELIAFRKSHPILHMLEHFQMTDCLECGYPDLSYHGDEAWKLDADDLTRHFAMLYCGLYAKEYSGNDDSFIYIAFNMHWASHEFGLPKLSKEKNWFLVMDTNKDICEKTKIKDQKKIIVNERSIKILIGE